MRLCYAICISIKEFSLPLLAPHHTGYQCSRSIIASLITLIWKNKQKNVESTLITVLFNRQLFLSVSAIWFNNEQNRATQLYPCQRCGRTYNHRSNLLRHLRLECGVGPRFKCQHCGKRFKHRHHQRDHEKTHVYDKWRTTPPDPLDFT